MSGSGFTTELKVSIKERQDYHCLRCGVNSPDGDVHHRRPRMMGGGNARLEWINAGANLVLLCRGCHHHLEANPAEARAGGYRLDHGDLPDDVLVFRYDGLWVRLHGGRAGDGLFVDPVSGFLAPFVGAPAPRWSLAA
jgi:5-methylcytosine-specific restriction protein A